MSPDEVIQRVDGILQRSLQNSAPLEVDPARTELFTVFASCHAAGWLREDAAVDLTADEFCRELARRWGLDIAAQQSVTRNEKIPPEHVHRMRLLWSFLRMWMEWTYAWDHWAEWHAAEGQRSPPE